MKTSVPAIAIALIVAAQSSAQDMPAPEECLARPGAASVVVTYGARSYRLAGEECRAQFLSDPERYSQLYDALIELEAEDKAPRPARAASLVPS